ncbi:thioredoxin fold domain-containing protein [Thiomicrorhabdus sp. Kp2]|uniref:thioredoxin family protein n=1 Tax=Thiomicrorhabdus sp. Kp2 TaxID=1123518 RepID=UPI000687331A|nr:thioredoxin fold domain-containing protein [Thiomicrorhabdus sp. Kp2]
MSRFIRFYALILMVSTEPISANNHSEFKELANLQTLAEKSEQLQLPIMLMFGAQWCEYCELLNESVFNPMALGKLYEERVVLMRHVGVDESAPIPDWNGQLMNKANWAYKLNSDLTPTVLFLDSKGQEVAPRIVGVSEITLYAGLIHERLNIAYKNMGLTKQIPVTPEKLEIQYRSEQSRLQ